MADEHHAAPHEAHADLASRLEDLLHVSVGLGILAFQKAQVHRQDLKKAVHEQLGPLGETVRDYAKVVEERLQARRPS